jgi:hypothetical protein
MAEGLEEFKLNEIQHMAETMNTSAANLLDLLGNCWNGRVCSGG